MPSFRILAFALIISFALGQECASNGTCDTHPRCSVWKDENECLRNRVYMNKHCPASCGVADKPMRFEDLPAMTDEFGVRQVMGGSSAEADRTAEIVRASIAYMKSRDVIGLGEACKNDDENCSFWASIGECEKNSVYMKRSCGPACGICHI